MNLVLNVTGRMDDIGKPAWIAAMVLGFVIWWPIGLAILAFILWSGRMGCHHGRYSSEMRERWARFRQFGCGSRNGGERGYRSGPGYSGNSAFEEYKAETLKRLEDEQKEFLDFLYRLRSAKDKAEFDQFMAERRSRPAPEPRDEGTGQPQP